MRSSSRVGRRLRTLTVGVLLPVASTMLSMRVTAADIRPGTLVFAGAGSNVPIILLLAEAFGRTRPDVNIHVPASIGSTGGIRAVADRAIAVALIARPLREQERGMGLTVVPYARTAQAIAVHPSVADEEITFDEIVQIYRGKKTRWRDGREIVVLTREPGDSMTELMERHVPGFKEAYAESWQTRRWKVLYTDQDMNRWLANTPHGIGFSDMGQITGGRLPLKVLKLNGVLPTPESVLSGRYPLVKTQAFVFRPDGLPAGARAFMDFVRSREGERILRTNGYVPTE